MSYRTKMLIPVVGMIFVLGYVAIKVVSGEADEIERMLPATVNNLSEASSIEVKYGNGHLAMSGSFAVSKAKPDEIERKAVLAGAGSYAEAKGKAEIEVSKMKNGAMDQELEIEINGLGAATEYRLFLDGQEIGAFTTDAKGIAEIEFNGYSPAK